MFITIGLRASESRFQEFTNPMSYTKWPMYPRALSGNATLRWAYPWVAHNCWRATQPTIVHPVDLSQLVKKTCHPDPTCPRPRTGWVHPWVNPTHPHPDLSSRENWFFVVVKQVFAQARLAHPKPRLALTQAPLGTHPSPAWHSPKPRLELTQALLGTYTGWGSLEPSLAWRSQERVPHLVNSQ